MHNTLFSEFCYDYSHTVHNTVPSESRCELRLRYVDLVVSTEVAPLECDVVSLYSVVKQRLKCKCKVCNCLIQFLLTVSRGHHFQHPL
jgi:hypothetical protein